MSQKAITVENLSKIYRIGTEVEKSENIIGAVGGFLRSPLRNFRKYRSLYNFDDVLSTDDRGAGRDDILWALRDLEFEVNEGEIVGIVGVNGAGKTTLLKILSRITPPTTGRILSRGRISSLLEVGTGFHPELTGRENVFLNGTILGMRKKQIVQKFDEIIDFSGVEQFLDTPVKRYSVGMRVRLAFAVAAHLEPEILIIDEVLAVGDAEFQRKCLAKMENVGESGRTVLFVSHNMAAVTRLCSRAILLDAGSLVADGPAPEVVSRYLSAGQGTTAERTWSEAEAPGKGPARLRAVRTVTDAELGSAAVDIRKRVGLQMEFDVVEDGQLLFPQFMLSDEQGVQLFTTLDVDSEWFETPRSVGRYTATAWIPGNLLAEGTYYVKASMRTPDRLRVPFNQLDAIAFYVVDNSEEGSARSGWAGKMKGAIRPKLDWENDSYVEVRHRNVR